jgi:DNA modification methylase
MTELLSHLVGLVHGDCMDVLRRLPADTVDSVVTDPPYHLTAIKGNGGGFMGKAWDGGDIAFTVELWAAVLRVLKPGGHLVAFGGTRGYHRMACAIEDAGFEVRDSLCWLYGTGFPKSHDVSKGIDKAAGAEREVIGEGHAGTSALGAQRRVDTGYRPQLQDNSSYQVTIPATDAAREWQGWGTALKPAFEPIVLARKPLSESTVAANVLRWRTGALNIDGCRVETDETIIATRIALGSSSGGVYNAATTPGVYKQNAAGRWPANVCHDGSAEVVNAFPGTAPSKASERGLRPISQHRGCAGETPNINPDSGGVRGHTDAGGSAARFFYSSKASKADRAGSKHPTIKPISLMAWLARLVTPPGGLVLDPFAGSGTTGVACEQEGLRSILIEREAEYIADIRRRFNVEVNSAITA